MRKVAFAGLSALMVFAFSCGGGGSGGGGDIGFPIGGGSGGTGGGGGQGIRINSFTVSPTNIGVGTSFTADWNITTSNYCWLAMYAYSQPTLPSGDAKFDYLVAEAGCPLTLPTVTGGFVCTLRRDGNNLLADCSLRTGQVPQTETLSVRGPAYFILEACTLVATGTGIDTVCDRRSVAVTLPQ